MEPPRSFFQDSVNLRVLLFIQTFSTETLPMPTFSISFYFKLLLIYFLVFFLYRKKKSRFVELTIHPVLSFGYIRDKVLHWLFCMSFFVCSGNIKSFNIFFPSAKSQNSSLFVKTSGTRISLKIFLFEFSEAQFNSHNEYMKETSIENYMKTNGIIYKITYSMY